jgi:SAM-dependent methyltransferase
MVSAAIRDPAVDFLAGLAGGGVRPGVRRRHRQAGQLHHKRPDLPVVVGDMATTTAPGTFSLVYVVSNSIGNVRTQSGQVDCFRNAARHLAPGGHFVVELGVPQLRRFRPGQTAVPFHVGGRHVGFHTPDVVTQQGTSHHYWPEDDGTLRYATSNHRYV